MTYAAAIQFLSGLQKFGARFGLDTTRDLAAAVGNPQARLRFIHVAGTNGKGSTCAMLESIYRAAGLRVGLFTSPHLVTFRERIQVDRQLIPEAEVARLIESTAHHTSGHETTFFEFVTVMALQYFAEQNCDLVIWETGLGGRLDATNIVTPLASVITNIGLDHQQWLGSTLPQIAAEKAGIIKTGIPIITATANPESLRVISEFAAAQHAPLRVVTAHQFSNFALGAALPLAGAHQKLNAATAIGTVEALQPVFPIRMETVRQGLESVHWPGRLQMIRRESGQQILLDGAHNVPGVESLREALLSNAIAEPSTERRALILGVMEDKDCQLICEMLAPLAQRIVVVALSTERTSNPATLGRICRQANPAAAVVTSTSLAEALDQVATEGFVVITGSLYLVGEALGLLQKDAAQIPSERSLNNWRGGKGTDQT